MANEDQDADSRLTVRDLKIDLSWDLFYWSIYDWSIGHYQSERGFRTHKKCIEDGQRFLKKLPKIKPPPEARYTGNSRMLKAQELALGGRWIEYEAMLDDFSDEELDRFLKTPMSLER